MTDRELYDSQLDWLWKNYNNKTIVGSGNTLLTKIEIRKLINSSIDKLYNKLQQTVIDIINSEINDTILPLLDEKLVPIYNIINDIIQQLEAIDLSDIRQRLNQQQSQINQFSIQLSNLTTKVNSNESNITILQNYMNEDLQFSEHVRSEIDRINQEINYRQYYDVE